MNLDDEKMFDLVYKQAKHKEKFPPQSAESVEEKYERKLTEEKKVKRLIQKWSKVLDKLGND